MINSMETRHSETIPSAPIDYRQVQIDSSFWNAKLQTNRERALPFQYTQLEKSGRIDALRLQWTPGSSLPTPHCFWDSDVAKWIEAASYSLVRHPDAELQDKVEQVVELFVAAQQSDGYLNSCFTVKDPHLRWKNLQDNHELYSAGHIFEAAVAHHDATGSRKFLDVAIRYADYIGTVFGREPGKLRGYCGHEEIELALVRLAKASGDLRFVELASYFVEERGQSPAYFQSEPDTGQRNRAFGLAYYQAHRPVREQNEAVGHAVRAVYLYCAMADLAREKSDVSLFEACLRLWENVAQTRLYITGQIGSTPVGEAFTQAYDLPNETAYCETCAGVGLIMWNHRMLQLDCDSRYADQIERTLYNGALSGMALDGRSFFYQNPLADRGKHRRSEWFDCSCCPSNISRLMSSLGSYVASTTEGGVMLHQYIGGSVSSTMPDGRRFELLVETDYPWKGAIRVGVKGEGIRAMELGFRIPGWCKQTKISVNGTVVECLLRKGYAILRRDWKAGDVIELDFSMPIERMVAQTAVLMDRGQIALQRGPVVYCFEDADHPLSVFDLVLPDAAEITSRQISELGGITIIEGRGIAGRARDGKIDLYRSKNDIEPSSIPFRAIPYFAWANRTPGAMTVWVPCA